jgi:RimJ/RimL family protein N-acetyltransferase
MAIPSPMPSAGAAPAGAAGRPPLRLPGGGLVQLRPVRPGDGPGLAALVERSSLRSRLQRFFSPVPRLPARWIEHFASADGARRLGWVAELQGPGGGQLIGHVQCEPAEDEPGTGEIAALVEDRWQGRGVGRALIGEVLRAGTRRGIRIFRADVLAENRRMLGALARWTEILSRHLEDGVVSLRFRPPGPA